MEKLAAQTFQALLELCESKTPSAMRETLDDLIGELEYCLDAEKQKKTKQDATATAALPVSRSVHVNNIAPTAEKAKEYLWEHYAGEDGILNAASSATKDGIGKVLGALFFGAVPGLTATVDMGLHHGTTAGVSEDDIVLKLNGKNISVNCKCIGRTGQLPSYQVAVQRYVSAADAYFLVLWKHPAASSFKTWDEMYSAIDYIALVDSAELINYKRARRFRVNMKTSGPEFKTESNGRSANKSRTGFKTLRIPAKFIPTPGVAPKFEQFAKQVTAWLTSKS